MRNLLSSSQRGIGHVGIILAIVVVLAAGGVGWWVWQKNKDDSSSNLTKAQQDAIKNARCDYDDKDLCKFFTSWKATEHFTVASTAEANGQQVTTTIQNEGDDKSYIKTTGGPASYEAITIGNTLYVKGGDTWYRQTINEQNAEEYKSNVDLNFNEPTTEDEIQTEYKKIGTEKCGDLTCFKYEIVDPNNPDAKQYLWFDDKDYQLRRTQLSGPDGTYDATFSYGKVSISEPSPVKDLAPNQYIVPGQSEPVTLPNTGDMPNAEELQNLINQYQ